ncbi:hypothetical protein HDV05_003847 [Chytridiales sp. JEL 0842]|nr:hypothetical protein HDV05_003847 [Chytridiales sp. JEL 0842]
MASYFEDHNIADPSSRKRTGGSANLNPDLEDFMNPTSPTSSSDQLPTGAVPFLHANRDEFMSVLGREFPTDDKRYEKIRKEKARKAGIVDSDDEDEDELGHMYG